MNNNLTQRNITFDSNLHTLFTVDSIKSLQSKISSKMALYINKEHASKRNDLSLCLQGEKSYQRLAEYIKMLEDIKYCNTCYTDFNPSEIIQAINNNINKLF